MNNLKEEIAKIHDFVNAEFDIEDNNELEAVKATLSLEKIEMLDNMLNDYKKAVNKLKRKEQQRKAQEAFKQVGTNLRIEEYEIYKNLAESKKMTISQYVKEALNRFKTVSTDTNVLENELSALKAKYEAIEAEKKALLEQKTTDAKNIENLTQQKNSAENDKQKYFQEMTSLKSKYEEKKTEIQKILVDNINIKDLKKEKTTLETDLAKKELEIKTLKSLSIFELLKMKISERF